MVRTRIRELQAEDIDFLSEQEGGERFFFKDGYGTNSSDLHLADGYSVYADNIISVAKGSFTPVPKIGATTQTCTYAVGKYTKVGNLVTVTASMSFTKSGTGTFTIEGLPFAAMNITNLTQQLFVGGDGLVPETLDVIYRTLTYPKQIEFRVEPTSTTLTLYPTSATTNFQTTVTINVTGTYMVD